MELPTGKFYGPPPCEAMILSKALVCVLPLDILDNQRALQNLKCVFNSASSGVVGDAYFLSRTLLRNTLWCCNRLPEAQAHVANSNDYPL
eukprot:2294322-Amphidinium_carterae.1